MATSARIGKSQDWFQTSILTARTYGQAIASSFPQSWNGAKMVTVENQKLIANMQFTSDQPLDELLGECLGGQTLGPFCDHSFADQRNLAQPQ